MMRGIRGFRGTLDGIDIEVIGRESLIRNERAAGRFKDLIDVNELTRGSARDFPTVE